MEEKNSETQPQAALPESKLKSVSDKKGLVVKVILLISLGLLVGTALVFASFKLGQKQVQPVPAPVPTIILTPTPQPEADRLLDETANWKTYTNTKYGYSIKYPRNWAKIEEMENARFFKGEYSPGHPLPETYISISIKENPRRLSLDVWIQEANPSDEIPISLTLDKMKAIKYISTKAVGTDSTLIFIEKNRIIYQLALVLMGENIEEAKQIFNLLLSTFKFLPSVELGQDQEKCVKAETGEKMSLSEAKEIVLASECVREGSLKETHFCNENSGTWWIDLDIQKQGCNPACVINVATKKAEINWRCTGLIPQ